ncbi:hypothetical protein [Hymenobacter norwichensis]|uniref:hypothetical protein n=1 Tax=Hymenobacter norwichensis TaxID=223903 RepID=UPI0003B35952|nr:hypothetical protein [Hymenobacter norwichensis]
MRKTAFITQPVSELKRLMMHETDGGVYLFGYNKIEDASCLWDEWYDSVAEAESAGEEYGVAPTDWQVVPDPLEGCQQDWITPVRVKGHTDSQLQKSSFEKLVDGQWLPLTS